MVRLTQILTGLWLLVLATLGSAAIQSDTLLNRLQPDGFVNDFAHVLNSQQRAALEQRVRDLQQKNGAELAVVTVASLEGGQVDDFTGKLFKRWGIGQKGKDNGVMLLVAIQDRKMRIEVGYGLEPILPDALAGRIIDEELRPQFRQSNYPEGLKRGVERIAAIIERGEPPSQLDSVKAVLFRPSQMQLSEQLGATAFFSLFVMIGAFLVGAGLGARVSFFVMFGLFFGGIPLLMACMMGGIVLKVLLPLGTVLLCVGFVKGRKNPGAFRQGSYRGSNSHTWVWGATSSSSSGSSCGGFSSGGGGGFGGGSSGGGGASGGW